MEIRSRLFLYSVVMSVVVLIFGSLLWENAYSYTIALLTFALVYCYYDFRKRSYHAIDIIFLFVLTMGATSLANLLGLNSIGNANESTYLIYAKKEYFNEVAVLLYISTLLVVVGFNLGGKLQLLPSFKTVTLSPKGTSLIFYLSLLSVVLKFFRILSGLGTISTAIYLLPVLSIFLLARLSATYKNYRTEIYTLLLLIITTAYAVLFEYLRINMIIPAVAYILGHVIGSKNAKSLWDTKMYLIYAFIGVFLTYFSIFGKVRSQYIEGLQRIDLLQQSTNLDEEGTFFSRISVLNQVSSVFSLVHYNGYYKGETLEYLGFALIPRIIWPEKPKIAKGRWFAIEIGQAIDYGNGRVNNSINMTVPGELYLNYGWWGAAIGSLFFGFLISAFWNATNFWEKDSNLFGNLFGFYLLFIGLFSLGADIQIIVSLLALYIMFYVSSLLINVFK